MFVTEKYRVSYGSGNKVYEEQPVVSASKADKIIFFILYSPYFFSTSISFLTPSLPNSSKS